MTNEDLSNQPIEIGQSQKPNFNQSAFSNNRSVLSRHSEDEDVQSERDFEDRRTNQKQDINGEGFHLEFYVIDWNLSICSFISCKKYYRFQRNKKQFWFTSKND